MDRLHVYVARAMDLRPQADVLSDDRRYDQLLASVGCTMANPYVSRTYNPLEDGLQLARHDMDILDRCDLVLADLSMNGYQYIGALYEMAFARIRNTPVIVVVGSNQISTRVFIQAFCDYIARDLGEAVAFIHRVYTESGIKQQMKEMLDYYDQIAICYQNKSIKPDRRGKKTMSHFDNERKELRHILRMSVRGKACQIGIGTGDWTTTVCEAARSVVGIEVSSNMIIQARKRLTSFSNVRILQCDIFYDQIEQDKFDCVVLYFFLSILPPLMQRRLFEIIRQILRPGGVLVVADTRKMCDVPASGLGRCQLQQRESGGNSYVLYKEHFVADTLSELLETNGFTVTNSGKRSRWFSWAVADYEEH